MSALTGEESKILEKVSQDLKMILDIEDIGVHELEVISDVTWPMIRRAVNGKGNYSMKILVKLLNSLGYSLNFTKVKKAIRAENNPVLLQKLIDKRKYNTNAKRRSRKQPEHKGAITRTKREKPFHLSSRKSIDDFTAKGDFLRAD